MFWIPRTVSLYVVVYFTKRLIFKTIPKGKMYFETFGSRYQKLYQKFLITSLFISKEKKVSKLNKHLS